MIIPQVFEKTPQGERAFDIFSRLLRDRIILLSSQIDDSLANLIVAQILFLEAEDPAKDINLYINSPGGSVTSALAVYDTMQFVKPDISTICTGMAGASAALLMSAGAPGERMCLPSTRFVLHQVYGAAEGPAIDVQIAAREVERQREAFNSLLAMHTGRAVKKIEKETERVYYLNATEAIEYGLVDRVIQSHSLDTKSGN